MNTIALIFLSLGPTKIITTNNTEILIADIGNNTGDLPRLSCHTDLPECCRDIDTGGQPLGDWYYPDGRVVQNRGRSEAAGESFYRGRNNQTVNLLHRVELNPLSQTGSYCCKVPTTGGNRTLCANLGICLECM